MIAAVVVSNLLYSAVAIVAAIVVALVIWVRRRKPKSVEANVASFNRGLRALAPDEPVRPVTSGNWGRARRPAAGEDAVSSPLAARHLAVARPAETAEAEAGSEPVGDDAATDFDLVMAVGSEPESVIDPRAASEQGPVSPQRSAPADDGADASDEDDPVTGPTMFEAMSGSVTHEPGAEDQAPGGPIEEAETG